MSDGPSDCAYAARAKADKLVANRWPGLKRINYHTQAPKQGLCLYVYEAWLTHIVEVVASRQVQERWRCEPFDEPTRMDVTDKDWPVGYYRHNILPRKGKA